MESSGRTERLARCSLPARSDRGRWRAQGERRDWLAVRCPHAPTAVGGELRANGETGSLFVARTLRPRSVESSGRTERLARCSLPARSDRGRWRAQGERRRQAPDLARAVPRLVGLRHALAGARAAQADRRDGARCSLPARSDRGRWRAQGERRDWLAVRCPHAPTAVGGELRANGETGSLFVARTLRPRSVESSGRPERWGSPFIARTLRPRSVESSGRPERLARCSLPARSDRGRWRAQGDRRDWLAVRCPHAPTAVGGELRANGGGKRPTSLARCRGWSAFDTPSLTLGRLRPTGEMGSPFIARTLRPRSVEGSGRPERARCSLPASSGRGRWRAQGARRRRRRGQATSASATSPAARSPARAPPVEQQPPGSSPGSVPASPPGPQAPSSPT